MAEERASHRSAAAGLLLD